MENCAPSASLRSGSARSVAKREAILDSAQSCFLDHGYANTSMDMVAANAGVSKATIYAHFKGKDDLFGAIIQRRCDDHVLGLGGLDAMNNGDLRSTLTAMATYLLDMLTQPEVLGIYRMVVSEAPRHPDLARAYYEQGPVRGKRRLAELFGKLQDQGLLERYDTLHMADQFSSLVRGEYFNRRLIGLPDSDIFTRDGTIRAAVDAIARGYGRQQQPAP